MDIPCDPAVEIRILEPGNRFSLVLLCRSMRLGAVDTPLTLKTTHQIQCLEAISCIFTLTNGCKDWIHGLIRIHRWPMFHVKHISLEGLYVCRLAAPCSPRLTTALEGDDR